MSVCGCVCFMCVQAGSVHTVVAVLACREMYLHALIITLRILLVELLSWLYLWRGGASETFTEISGAWGSFTEDAIPSLLNGNSTVQLQLSAAAEEWWSVECLVTSLMSGLLPPDLLRGWICMCVCVCVCVCVYHRHPPSNLIIPQYLRAVGCTHCCVRGDEYWRRLQSLRRMLLLVFAVAFLDFSFLYVVVVSNCRQSLVTQEAVKLEVCRTSCLSDDFGVNSVLNC